MEIIAAKNGFFEKYKDDLFEAYIRVTGDPSKEELNEHCAPTFKRMPLRLFKQALAFCEFAFKSQQSEGMIMFRYRNDVWELLCPPQWNGGASVHYHAEPAEEFVGVVGDLHSHPKMGSFHSSTDHHDEGKMFGVYMVINDFRIMNCNPDIVAHIRGTRFKMEPHLFFDESDAGGDYTFPEEWKGRLHKMPCDVCAAIKAKEDKEKEGAKEGPSSRTFHISKWADGIYPRPDAQGAQSADADAGSARGAGTEEVVSLLKGNTPPAFLSELIMKRYERWYRHGPGPERTLPFNCDNKGCEKDLRMLSCPLCHRDVGARRTVQNIADHADRALKALHMGTSGILYSGGLWNVLKFTCDNVGCLKETPYLNCGQCRKPIHTKTILRSLGTIMDDAADVSDIVIIQNGKEVKQDTDTKRIESPAAAASSTPGLPTPPGPPPSTPTPSPQDWENELYGEYGGDYGGM